MAQEWAGIQPLARTSSMRERLPSSLIRTQIRCAPRGQTDGNAPDGRAGSTSRWANFVDDLLENSKKLLMLPLATLGGLLPKLVRRFSRDRGKDAELTIRGET